jgi:predicted ABC-type ATPase
MENTCEIFTKDGKRAIDAKSIESLTKCVMDLPQTKLDHVSKNGEYTESRKKLHAEIIKEFKEGVVCIDKAKPIAVLMGGSPASGKSTFLKKYRPYLLTDNLFKVDADEIRAKLPEYKGWNATQTHEETGDIVKTLISDKNIGVPCKFDFIYDGTMTSTKKYLALVELLKSEGYEVYVVFISNIPKKVVKKRALERYQKSGRFVPLMVIDDFYENGEKTFDQVKTKVDGYIVVDGSTFDYNIMEKGGKSLPNKRIYSKLGEKLQFALGGAIGKEYESHILTDAQNKRLNLIFKNPIFNDAEEIETFGSGGGFVHTMVLLYNGHVVTFNHEDDMIQYSYYTYDSIEDYLSEENAQTEQKGWDNEMYTPNAGMRETEISRPTNKFFEKMKKTKDPESQEMGGVEFIPYKGEEIMHAMIDDLYYANDVEFKSLKAAKKYIDSGETPDYIKEAYRRGLMRDGGNIEQEQNEMFMSQTKEAKHHIKELEETTNPKTKVEPWVLAKMTRAKTDLSDLTHYLEGRKESFGNGGSLDDLQINQIARLSGVRSNAIKEWVSENNLTSNDVSNIMVGLGRKQIKPMDFSTAIIGNKNNKYSKDIIAYAKSNSGYKLAGGGGIDKVLEVANFNVFSPEYKSKTHEEKQAYEKSLLDKAGIAEGDIVYREINGEKQYGKVFSFDYPERGTWAAGYYVNLFNNRQGAPNQPWAYISGFKLFKKAHGFNTRSGKGFEKLNKITEADLPKQIDFKFLVDHELIIESSNKKAGKRTNYGEPDKILADIIAVFDSNHFDWEFYQHYRKQDYKNDYAKRYLDLYLKYINKPLLAENIDKVIQDYFDVSIKEVKSKDRANIIVLTFKDNTPVKQFTIDWFKNADYIPEDLKNEVLAFNKVKGYQTEEQREGYKYETGGNIKWSDAVIGDSALVISENKMGLIIKDYGRKFHLRFSDGSEKTYDASELNFYKLGDDEYGRGGSLKLGDVVEVVDKNIGFDGEYYVVDDNVGPDRNDFLISDVRKRAPYVWEEDQLKKLYYEGGEVDDDDDDDEIDYNNISDVQDELGRLRRWANQYNSRGADSKIKQLEARIEYLRSKNKMAGGGDVRNKDWFTMWTREGLQVELGAFSNPDIDEDNEIEFKRVSVKSIDQAVKLVKEFINENDLGVGEFIGAQIYDNGKPIAYVSYNLKVWEGKLGNLNSEPYQYMSGGKVHFKPSDFYKLGGSVEDMTPVEAFFSQLDYSMLPAGFANYVREEILTDSQLEAVSENDPIFIEIKSKVNSLMRNESASMSDENRETQEAIDLLNELAVDQEGAEKQETLEAIELLKELLV